LRRWECRRKKLDGSVLAQAVKSDVTTTYSFRAGFHGTSGAAFSLKQLSCPHCEHSETLNRHSILYGNDPFACAQQRVRGQRVLCSNRGRRGGCGKTFSLFLADTLPRHTLTATLLWGWLVQKLAGLSAKAAAEKARLPFALETVYHLGRKLRRGLDRIRTLLCRKQAPPSSTQSDPVLQSVEHLQSIFPHNECPPVAFQLHFQLPFVD
jgi:hypothetical protein